MSSAAAPLPHTHRRPSRLLSRKGAFALHTSVLVGLLAASSAPTPLYAEYQAEWHFSALTVTIVFSAYALALMMALLMAGTLSDHLGRRPVLAVALLAEAASMAVFITAQGVTQLIVARTLQGLATGVATGAAGAAVLDFEHPRHRGRAALANSVTPVSGMAAGVLVSTALVQYGPAPTRAVYLLLLLLFAAQAAAVPFTAETARLHPGLWRSLQPRIAVAPASRRVMLVVAPGVTAAWALGGFYSSLGPQLAHLIAPHALQSVGGLVFFTLSASAAVAVCVLGPRPAGTVSTVGAAALAAGALVTLGSPRLHSLLALFIGTLLAGVGFGAVTQGALRHVLPPAAPEERAGTLSAYYVLSYLAMSVPAVVAGLLTNRYGLDIAVQLYAGSAGLLALAALAVLGATSRHHHDTSRTPTLLSR